MQVLGSQIGRGSACDCVIGRIGVRVKEEGMQMQASERVEQQEMKIRLSFGRNSKAVMPVCRRDGPSTSQR